MEPPKRIKVIDILQKHNLFAKKSFGQNFLKNDQPVIDIVKAADVNKKDTVIEVGPGLGILTQELAKNAKKVISLELDQTLLPLLDDVLKEYPNVEILNQDALKFIPPKIAYKVVANIPYNITSHLINHFLQTENPPISMTLLVQKEVAEKICILEPDMTVLSLQIALFGQAKYVKKVPSAYFHPQPKVDSAIIHIALYDKKNPNYLTRERALKILRIAKTCFSNRRKKLSNTLPPEYHEQAKKSGIDLSRRPETLSTQEWAAIYPGDTSLQ
ncbi:MAG: 16S rRNA (adenine(1518)-N(6)/adenine(1519)-N(6))-dimethyltransferase RsmA [Candidatus Gracilibacteria bacterium]